MSWRKWRLDRPDEHEERRVRRSGSRRLQGASKRARGSTDGVVALPAISVARGRRRRCRGRCGASQLTWLGGVDADGVAELSSTLEGRGRPGGRGNSERRRRHTRPWGGQRSEGKGGPESEGEVRGGRGGGVALVEASRSGGSRRWPRARRPHARRPSGVLLARGGRRWRLWWAGPAPGPWWGARYVQVRGPVAFSLSLT